ncbi:MULTISPECIES: UDP-N-acetylglucosamine 1-carboxyvinyltransferase [unclassified Campylobacter]|uniref:UDP-N-acetylglucosamine 1-carboxyvinyltransferase n=1 Tax=unclassified Campylobacter TaxID=2593542 RepID=UPI0022E9D017|nr:MULTISPECIES: UDP-N-acetylglucosamine 1-carboxyvinyltransferase [unclassified Campylobacter]MDA3043546.1 UDP-N-acetylglucosamine 1-carboxyvinyltransferase [Campylobacter sp. JMF_09 ED2]MDA3044093.1 UDP-N-acetylglucosamine 1-carboxyvinyltransferase [Campylobacter sp. JMF_07 ED4]MDA3063443.1 UDP-N-acetylglucosamine 1-carboxyvinyltransferase [Campylobacter sp. JMF_11 EL3]MDA3071068.1 UDP-N-acetylglucosamine 1-carboxyvinyltransferase [Campylobacter sp. VBCF_03 NA9]MDA3074528.1 UDP-N-acetylgluco
MHYLQIKGEAKLSGEIKISGAKNAALPLIALIILSKNPVTIKNLPDVSDIKTLIQLLANLGAKCEYLDAHTAIIDPRGINSTKAVYDIVRKMRASILVLGPLLTRFGKAEVSMPGGCAIGARPIDLHLKAVEKMGAQVKIEEGYVVCEGALKGANISFDKITVTGTENVVMAAALAHGETCIINAAKEPEVVAVCEALASAGVKIEGIGTDELKITGTAGELLNINEITVIPDRIEAGTYLCAGAITNSKISVTSVNPAHLGAVLAKFEDMGFKFEISGSGNDSKITILPADEIKATKIITTEYPGFPTDMQAQFMALTCVAQGTSTVEERLFENRFMHVSELNRMGADIKLNGNIATIKGGKLAGADVMATDLRASSALVLAALAASGTTRVHRIYHLDRGYESLEAKFSALGAQILRLEE